MNFVGKKTLGAALIVAGTVIGISTGTIAETSPVRTEAVHSAKTDTIPVPDMQCGMCESRISKKLTSLKGVSSVAADAELKQVIVTYDSKKLSRPAIEKAIAEIGYDAGKAVATTKAKDALPMCCRPGGEE